MQSLAAPAAVAMDTSADEQKSAKSVLVGFAASNSQVSLARGSDAATAATACCPQFEDLRWKPMGQVSVQRESKTHLPTLNLGPLLCTCGQQMGTSWEIVSKKLSEGASMAECLDAAERAQPHWPKDTPHVCARVLLMTNVSWNNGLNSLLVKF